MTTNRADVWRLLGYIEGDLRQTLTKLTELRAMLAGGALDREPTDTITCPHPHCRAPFTTEERLLEHVRNVHGEE